MSGEGAALALLPLARQALILVDLEQLRIPAGKKGDHEQFQKTIFVDSAGLVMDFNYYGRLIRVGLLNKGKPPATGKPTVARPGADVEARSEDPELLLGLSAGDAIERMGSEMSVGTAGIDWPAGHPDPDEMRTSPAAVIFFRKKGRSLTINYYGEVIAVNRVSAE